VTSRRKLNLAVIIAGITDGPPLELTSTTPRTRKNMRIFTLDWPRSSRRTTLEIVVYNPAMMKELKDSMS
jgi:hypothetical protein